MSVGKLAVPRDNVARHVNLTLDHILVNFDIPGLLIQPHCSHDLINIGSGRAWVGNHLGCAGNFLKDMKLGFDFLSLVVDEYAKPAFFFTWAAANDQNRHPFGKRSSHSIDDIMAAS